MRRTWIVVLAATVAACAIGACSSDDAPVVTTTPPQSGSYRGVLTGANESGVLEATVSGGSTSGTKTLTAGNILTVTATLKLAGATVMLTGTLDPSTGAFDLSGGGYALKGTFAASGISGTYSGPHGTGTFVLLTSAQGTVSSFCGAFNGDDTGIWNISAVPGGSAVGAWATRAGTAGTFAGTWGNDTTLILNGSPISATGRLLSTSGEGTWTSSNNKHGTWTTGACAFAPITPDDAGADATVPPDDAGGTVDATVDAPSDVTLGTDANDAAQHDAAADSPAVDAADAGSDAATADAATDAAADGGSADGGTTDGAADGGSADGGTTDGAADGGGSDAAADASSDAAADAGLGYTEVVTDQPMCNLASDGAYIYIGYCKGKGVKRIAVNAPAGTTPTDIVGSAYVLNMVVDSNVVYWLDNNAALMKAPTDVFSATGTTIASASNITGSGSINVANGRVYWIDSDGQSGAIHSVATTGGTVATLVAGGVTAINSLGVDGTHNLAYYGITGELRRISTLQGIQSTTVRASTARNVQYSVSNSALFWTEADLLWQRNAAATDSNTASLPNVNALIIYSDFAFYRSSLGGFYKANAFANQVPTLVSSDVTGSEFVIAPPYIYWRTNDAQHLRRAAY